MSAAAAVTGAPVLEGRGLARRYDVGGGLFGAAKVVQAVNGVDFTLRRGETLAVVGESGCGKSTLARLVTLIEPPSDGELLIDGKPALVGDAALRRRVQIVFQDPYGSLNPRQTIADTLSEPLRLSTADDAATRQRKVEDVMKAVGLRPEFADRYPHMFSGGQRQRIAIARALMLKPALIVADEPVSALDVSIQAQVLNLLADLQQELGLAYLFISHDLGVVRHIAHDVLVMYLGHAVEQGEKKTIFAQPLHPYTQALLASTPGIVSTGVSKKRIVLSGELPSPLNPPSGCVFSTRCPHVVAQCHNARPELRELAGRKVACHLAEQFIQPV